ncbi:30S ribosomal protein S16 [Galbibacter sp. EGI 63066]|uniref:30S ribosomal protein S16 n=1 Tax=Galbibacter sp. EGI 63066 TaxID=2993559 RepID=UPI0022491458|nr:30S ribosomal protein S16 [Galbibacter sp. EGI 63066]MCX2678797.1 30S ribosomal protein S16 [Galbibacter sp. EGI 63066]
MPVKIRLQRHGKKGKPFYWVVAADARAKRDGKFLEKLGIYNPNTNPAQIELDIDSSVKWLQNGAQPTDTARRILSYKGVLLKHHLLGGVAKGALTEEEAQKKFEAWVEEKEGKVDAKKEDVAKAEAEAKAKALEAEKEINEKRKAEVAEAEAPAEEEVAEEAAPEAEAEAKTEEPAAEAETKEEEKVEAKEEEKAEAKAEEPAAEDKKENKAEAKEEEKKADA